eukprot:scaffold15914_cov140-Skeletonema_marinoi.AAC.5
MLTTPLHHSALSPHDGCFYYLTLRIGVQESMIGGVQDQSCCAVQESFDPDSGNRTMQWQSLIAGGGCRDCGGMLTSWLVVNVVHFMRNLESAATYGTRRQKK